MQIITVITALLVPQHLCVNFVITGYYLFLVIDQLHAQILVL